ncbi:uncharacterized protein [Typha angustifolia]|uniref:uncharacterized protein n=1 Tax=Typha angustifolia TaxID=59011 RepID=UPI003C2F4751
MLLDKATTAAAAIPLPLAPPRNHSSSSSSRSRRDVWRRRPGRSTDPRQTNHYLDRSVDMSDLLSRISLTTNSSELHAVLSPFVGSGRRPLLSLRFMCSLLSRLPSGDHRRSLALLDWLVSGPASYPSSLLPFNLALRNLLRSRQFHLAAGLFLEMRAPPHSLSPDAFSYSTLLSALSSAGLLDQALSFLPIMSADRVVPDLVLYSTLIHLALRLNDPSKAVALFSRLRAAGITPDLKAFNAALAALSAAGLLDQARNLLLSDMPTAGVAPDAISYSTLLSALVKRRRYLAALSLFSHMRNEAHITPDLTVCNIVIHVYGQLGLAREADRLFWSMRRLGVEPGVVTYNTMLRVYGDAELFGEAVHLFRLMQRKGVPQNVVTYNTMIAMYGKSLEHEKAGNLVQEMQKRGVQPNAITYSTIISIWGKAGKLDRAAKLFQKLREAGAEIDPVLYQTMIVVYERAGLVAHAKRLLHELKHPDNIPKDTAIKILANADRVEEAAWVFRQAAEAGEVKDVSVYKSMVDLFSRNRRHKNVVEVFDSMRKAGYFPDSEMIANVLNAYGKLQEFDMAATLYQEMQEEGCIFSDRVHYQMLSLLGARRDFKGVELLLEKLRNDPDIDKKELHLVAAGIYERANKLDEASHIIGQIRNSEAFAIQ